MIRKSLALFSYLPTMRTLLLLVLPCFSIAQSIQQINGKRLWADSLTNKIEYLMQAAAVSGVAVSVFNNGNAVYSKTFGYADVPAKKPLTPSSEMYAASLAKTVFAYIAMQLVEEKRIHLDTPLVNYLKQPLPSYVIKGWNRGYHDLQNDQRYEKITARMCLTHTTGFPNWRWFESDKKLKIKFDPGTRYSYSGEGLYLLQFVLEQITQTDYETMSRQRVFTPFGMTRTSQVWQPAFDTAICYGHNAKGEPYELMKWKEASAGGSMTTTLGDYTKFFAAFIKGTGLSAERFNEMTNTQIRIRSKAQFGPLSREDAADNDSIKLGYGLGVGVFHTPYGRAFFKEGHDDGWGHYSIYFPDQKVCMLIMTNNDNGESIFKVLLEYAIGDHYTPWRWENYIPFALTSSVNLPGATSQ